MLRQLHDSQKPKGQSFRVSHRPILTFGHRIAASPQLADPLSRVLTAGSSAVHISTPITHLTLAQIFAAPDSGFCASPQTLSLLTYWKTTFVHHTAKPLSSVLKNLNRAQKLLPTLQHQSSDHVLLPGLLLPVGCPLQRLQPLCHAAVLLPRPVRFFEPGMHLRPGCVQLSDALKSIPIKLDFAECGTLQCRVR
jgi:hypothetical protein